jgi:hypothetical protein
MAHFLRLACGAAVGLAVGARVAWWLFPSSPTVIKSHIDRPPAPPEFPPAPDCERWLDDEATLEPGLDANAFWSALGSSAKSGLDARQRLALEESLWGLSGSELVAVLCDERFARLEDPMEPRFALVWTNLLLKDGVAEAMRTVGGLPSAALRETLQTTLLEKLTRTDPEAGFEWMRSRPNFHNPIADFLETLAAIDPAKATELWNRLDSKSGRDFAGLRVVKGLMERDWKSAFDWACANASVERRNSYVEFVFESLRPDQRDNAFVTAKEISDPALRSAAYTGLLAARLRAQSVETVLTEALALPVGSLTAEGWGGLGRACAGYTAGRESTPGADQLRDLAARLPNAGREAFLEQAAWYFAVNDPPLGTQLFEHMTPETSRLMAEKWAVQNPTAASAWLTTLAESAQRDQAIAGFCRGIAPLDPSAAAEWALTLQASPLRERTIEEAVENWRRIDPASAAAWAADHIGPATLQ